MSRHALEWANPKLLKICGILDEDVRFEQVFSQFPEQVWIDFSGVTRINSCGVREWVRSASAFDGEIIYVNAPILIVDQFSMVPEFLGKKAIVESFQARFVCPHCGNEEIKTLSVGKDVDPKNPHSLSLLCGACKETSELDHNPDVYLEFLQYL
jgi:hypothetical protein